MSVECSYKRQLPFCVPIRNRSGKHVHPAQNGTVLVKFSSTLTSGAKGHTSDHTLQSICIWPERATDLKRPIQVSSFTLWCCSLMMFPYFRMMMLPIPEWFKSVKSSQSPDLNIMLPLFNVLSPTQVSTVGRL